MRNFVAILFGSFLMLVVSLANAVEISKLPLRSLNLNTTQVWVNPDLINVVRHGTAFFQNGKYLPGSIGLDDTKPFCFARAVLGLKYNIQMDAPFIEDFVLGDLKHIYGYYSDFVDSKNPDYSTELRITNEKFGRFELTCNEPSKNAFAETSIDSLELAMGDYLTFASINTKPLLKTQFANLSIELGPSFIYEPEKNLGRIAGVKNARLGLKIEKDLVFRVSETNPNQLEPIEFSGGHIKSATQNETYCSLYRMNESPKTLSEKILLLPRRISGSFEDTNTTQITGLPNYGRFYTLIEFEDSTSADLYKLLCVSKDSTPISYNETVNIFGNNLVWTVFN